MTDERRDDEILGRALARAVETIDVNETPYERSRLVVRPLRRPMLPVWQFAAAAAAVVLAVAIGSWLASPRQAAEPGPVAPSGSPSPTPSQPATPTPPPPFTSPLDHQRVYFARDGLPPVGMHVAGIGTQATAEERIASRLGALNPRSGVTPPSGGSNAYPSEDPAVLKVSSVRIQGDQATVDFQLPASGAMGRSAKGSAASLGLAQQLVYTATEEPGIRRVLFTENGGNPMTIDQLVLDKPLSREDVFGYASAGSTSAAPGHGATTGTTRTLITRTTVDQVALGLARVVIETDQKKDDPETYPDFNVTVAQNDESTNRVGGKWRLVVTVAHSQDRTTGTKIIDATPLRSLVASAGPGGSVVYEIGLDDLRPWRTALLYDPVRFVIDIGGAPSSIFGSNAVYAPAPGASVGRTFTVSGIASNYEANVVVRVRDSRGTDVFTGNTTATNCCEPGGSFELTLTLPSSVSGNVTLEVLESSARDGSDIKVIRVPLTVR
jgi:immunoglobulin-like protein involved in spore germination/sporulation and spore germination protein